MSPQTGRRIHLAMMAFWGLNMIVVWFVPVSWRIPYLVVCSIYANFVGHWSGLSAERPAEFVDS